MKWHNTLFVWILMLSFGIPINLIFAQTYSLVENPDWTIDSDWSLQAPCDGGKLVFDVVLVHNSAINFKLSVEHTLLVTPGITLTTSKEIDVKSGGSLDIEGIVILTNEGIKLQSGGMVHIYNGGHLIGEADVELKEVSGGMIIDEGGLMTWAGDWNLNGGNGTDFIINGQVIVEGDLSNKIDIEGSGGITLYGDLNNFPNASIFGCTLLGSACCLDTPCILGLGIILPVKLIHFKVQISSEIVMVDWLAASEENLSFYNVEKSTDRITWQPVANVYGGDESGNQNSYTIWDQNPSSGISYYRLSQSDFDGTITLLGLRSINFGAPVSNLYLYPNPTYGSIYFDIGNIENAQITILDCNGRILKSINSVTRQVEVNLEGFASGIYYVQLRSQGVIETKKMIIAE